jgi:hypothetical protein
LLSLWNFVAPWSAGRRQRLRYTVHVSAIDADDQMSMRSWFATKETAEQITEWLGAEGMISSLGTRELAASAAEGLLIYDPREPND